MNFYRKSLLGAALAALFISTSPAADEFAEKTREVFNKNKAAVVSIQAVVKVTMSGGGRSSGPREQKAEVGGLVVDPSGLTLAALSTLDPSGMVEDLSSGYKMETEISELKIVTDDDTEVPAEIVLRDKDLDLAFIRPKTKPTTPMTAVNLEKASPVQLLDQVLTITRLGKAAGRAYAASVERISAVVQKPRLFYIPDSTLTATREGAPAFAADGNIVGVFVIRTVAGRSSGGRGDNAASIILPAETILKAAKDAPEAKGDAPDKPQTKPADDKSGA